MFFVSLQLHRRQLYDGLKVDLRAFYLLLQTQQLGNESYFANVRVGTSSTFLLLQSSEELTLSVPVVVDMFRL